MEYEGVLEKVEQKTMETGNMYSIVTIDGEKFSAFENQGQLLPLPVGSRVVIDYVEKGRFKNMTNIRIVAAPNVEAGKVRSMPPPTTTPEQGIRNMPTTDRRIARMSAIKSACELLSTEAELGVDDVLKAAVRFEEWIYR